MGGCFSLVAVSPVSVLLESGVTCSVFWCVYSVRLQFIHLPWFETREQHVFLWQGMPLEARTITLYADAHGAPIESDLSWMSARAFSSSSFNVVA